MNDHAADSRLDAAIDQAVRQIMDVEPPPGLRRRVLARLDGRAPAAAPVAWWPRLGIAAATMAAIVLAVVYLRPDPGLPAPEPVDVIAQGPAPILTLPPVTRGADDERAEPVLTTPAAAPVAGAARQPQSERLPDPPRMDMVFGSKPDGRVAAASVVVPGALPEIEPLEVPPLPATLVTEAQDPPPAQEAKPGPATESQATQNVLVEVTLTEEGEGAAAPKTVSMLVANRELGRVRSGGDGVSLNVDARPSIWAEGRVRLMLTLEYSPGGVAPMTQSLTTILASGTPLVVSHSADPKSTRRMKVEVTATILK
jgi:hypothetical protein